MVAFIAVGVISLAMGVMFIFAPDALRRLSDAGSRFVTNIDSAALNHRLGVGLSLCIASLLFFFVAWYINLRG